MCGCERRMWCRRSARAASAKDALFLFATGETREAAAASRHDFESSQGDTLTMVNVFTAYADIAHRNPHGIRAWCDERFVSARALERTEVVRGQLRDAGAKLRCGTAEEAVARPLDADSSRGLRRALTVAFFAQTAGLQPSGEYVTLSSRRRETAAIHPASVLYRRRAKCVIFNELLFTTRFYMRVVTEIDAAWLPELAPQAFSNKALR